MMMIGGFAGIFVNVIDMFTNNYDLFFYGLRATLILAVFGTFFGLFIALVLVVFKIQNTQTKAPLWTRIWRQITKRFSIFYVGFFRGTPMMVQAMLFYYGLQSLGVRIPALYAGLIVVSLNTAAYLTEVIRSGLISLHKGQTEAALSLGMSSRQTYRKILFPQALRNMLPAIGNELVVNIKDTAVLSVIGVSEMFYMGRRIGSSTYQFVEAFIIVSIAYLIVVNIAVYLLMKFTGGKKIKRTYPMSESGALS